MNVILKTGKTMRALTILTIALAMLSMTACASRTPVISNPVEIDVTEYDRIFQASVDVLEDKGFRLDRQDYRFGVVTSHPRPSPSALEPWHRDNTSVGQAVESTLNYQRRRVSIRLIPASSTPANAESDSPAATTAPAATRVSDSYMLETQVVIEQVEAPRRYLTGSSAEGRMLRNLSAAPQSLKDKQVSENYWRPVGRDTDLEQRIVADILRRSITLARTQPRGPLAH
jgi:hypothetical protein